MINNYSGDGQMKTFKEYLTESKKEFVYRIKTIHPMDDSDIERIENHLAKYEVKSVQAPKKLMLQSAPYDFPQARGYEVHVIEFVTQRPASAYQIQTEISSLLGLSDGAMKVRSNMEPLEQQEMAQTDAEPEGSILEDGDYNDAEKVNSEDFYGDKYNTKFVKELLAMRKDGEEK